MSTKRILFLTTANLSTNPRLVKEAKLAKSKDIDFLIIAFNLGGRYQDLDKMIWPCLGRNQVIYLSDNRSKLFAWVTFSLIHRAIHLFLKESSSLINNAFWLNKRTLILMSFLSLRRRSIGSFDFVIGHNIGAFYPSYIYAKRTGTKLGIDVEDFHPGEKILDGGEPRKQKAKKILMREILPLCNYVSFASPLIKQKTMKLIYQSEIKKAIYISNSFFSKEFSYHPPISNTVKFVWFSQHLSMDRGIRIFLKAMFELGWEGIELSLIGNRNQIFDAEFESFKRPQIRLLDPLDQLKLHSEIGCYDVGLAIDLTNDDQNRDVALTNKIFAYYQAGLYEMVTDTAAQSDFLTKYPNAGLLVKQTVDGFKSGITEILKNINSIRRNKRQRYESAKSIAFEREGIKLNDIWS